MSDLRNKVQHLEDRVVELEQKVFEQKKHIQMLERAEEKNLDLIEQIVDYLKDGK